MDVTARKKVGLYQTRLCFFACILGEWLRECVSRLCDTLNVGAGKVGIWSRYDAG